MKTRIWITTLALGTGAAALIAATTQPGGEQPPATRPSLPQPIAATVAEAAPMAPFVAPLHSMPRTFEVVATRNIFLKGSQRLTPTTDEINRTGARSSAGASAEPPGTNQVLTGISVTNGGNIALIEDVQANTAVRVHVGDAVVTGKITKITLDSLEYRDASGRTMRIDVGSNLAGGQAPALAASTTQPQPESDAAASPNPAADAGPSNSPGGSDTRMEEFLKQRRLRELHQ